MTLRRLVGLTLVAVVLALVPAAHASPPDQSWIPGLYDNADFEDVVLLITGDLGATQPALVWSSRPVVSLGILVTPTATEPVPVPVSSVFGRAPPRAECPSGRAKRGTFFLKLPTEIAGPARGAAWSIGEVEVGLGHFLGSSVDLHRESSCANLTHQPEFGLVDGDQ